MNTCAQNPSTFSVSANVAEQIKLQNRIIETSSSIFINNSTDEHLEKLKSDCLAMLETLDKIQQDNQPKASPVKLSNLFITNLNGEVIAKHLTYEEAVSLSEHHQLKGRCCIQFPDKEAESQAAINQSSQKTIKGNLKILEKALLIDDLSRLKQGFRDLYQSYPLAVIEIHVDYVIWAIEDAKRLIFSDCKESSFGVEGKQ